MYNNIMCFEVKIIKGSIELHNIMIKLYLHAASNKTEITCAL